MTLHALQDRSRGIRYQRISVATMRLISELYSTPDAIAYIRDRMQRELDMYILDNNGRDVQDVEFERTTDHEYPFHDIIRLRASAIFPVQT